MPRKNTSTRHEYLNCQPGRAALLTQQQLYKHMEKINETLNETQYYTKSKLECNTNTQKCQNLCNTIILSKVI